MTSFMQHYSIQKDVDTILFTSQGTEKLGRFYLKPCIFDDLILQMEHGHPGLIIHFAMHLVEGVPRSGFARALIRREVWVGTTVLAAIVTHKLVTILNVQLVSLAFTIALIDRKKERKTES